MTVSSPSVDYTAVIKMKYITYITTRLFAHTVRLKTDPFSFTPKVSEVAGKEYAIEQAIDKMVSEWDGIVLEVVEYRETETCVIRVDEAITQALDDHIVMTQAMSFSPFKKPFEAKILEWERTLGMTSEVLDEWLVFPTRVDVLGTHFRKRRYHRAVRALGLEPESRADCSHSPVSDYSRSALRPYRLPKQDSRLTLFL